MSEGEERIERELDRIEREIRETNRLLRILVKEEAPVQLASSGATVVVTSP